MYKKNSINLTTSSSYIKIMQQVPLNLALGVLKFVLK